MEFGQFPYVHTHLIAHDLNSSKCFFFVGSTLGFCVGDFRTPSMPYFSVSVLVLAICFDPVFS